MSHEMLEKAPDDVLDYDVDFVDWLPPGDRLDAATASINQASVVVDRVDVSDKVAKIWLSGGVSGESGRVTLLASTAHGRTKEICIRIRVKGC